MVAAMRWLLAERYEGSQTKLAEAVGISASAIGQQLSGKNKPSYSTGRVIARLCETTIEEIYSGRWSPTSEPVVEREPADPRILEWVASGLVTRRAADALGPFLGGTRKRTDVELLTALRQAENAIQLVVQAPSEDDEVPKKRRK